MSNPSSPLTLNTHMLTKLSPLISHRDKSNLARHDQINFWAWTLSS